MKPDIQNIIKAVRMLEEIHQPEYRMWISMENITALCDEIERLTPKFEIGETVRVVSKNRERKGVITSKTENIYNTTKYQVYVRVPKRAFFLWFPESQIHKL